MAENDITTAKTPAPETTPDGGSSHFTVAISEENLLALLGPSPASSGSAKPVSSAPAKPAPFPPAAPVEATLAQLSPLQAETPEKNGAANHVPAVPMATPVPPNPAPASRKVQTPPESVGTTLALLAAIKENRAGMLRSEPPVKPVPEPAAVTKPVVNIVPDAKIERPSAAAPVTTPAASATPVPAPAPVKTTGPAAQTLAERIDRHPAIAATRSAAAASSAGSSLQGGFLTAAPIPDPPPLEALMNKIPGGRRTLLIAGVLIAVGGISMGLVMRGHRAAKPVALAPTTAPVSTANNFPLQLQLEPQGKGQLNIRWNPQSTLIAQAREGRLVITESNQKPRTIPLALDQLKIGHLIYQPQTERAEFRLEVADASGAVAEESVLSLAALPATTTPAAATATPSANTVINTAATSAAPNPAPSAPVAAATPVGRAAPRAFTPPSANRGTPEQGAVLDAPPDLGSNSAAPPLVSVQVPTAGAPPPAAGGPPAPAVAKQRVQVESTLQAAKLIKKITPIYPPLAKQARIQGVVHFKATIGKNGNVENLDVTGGAPLLRQAAIDAVKQWVYRPTLLDGQPVEVVTAIDVLFNLNQ
jgi:TonB family protein